MNSCISNRRLNVLLGILLWAWSLNAQYYSTGQDRGSLKWRQIKTERIQLIYPDYFEVEAQRLATVFETIYERVGSSLEGNPGRISIILHTESANSNGYVSWAPKRMELYTQSPAQDYRSEDWLESLAIHEMRHVVQMEKLKQGTTKVLSIFLGEQAVPLVLGLNIDNWFLEGDATLLETTLSNSGRGRTPEFTQTMRAYATQSEDWFSYDKSVLGSFKNWTPSRYELGYFMVGNARKNYGTHFWSEVLTQVARKPLRFNRFSKTIGKQQEEKREELYQKLNAQENTSLEAGKLKERWQKNEKRNAKRTLFNDNMTELQLAWKREIAQLDTTAYKSLSRSPRIFTNYRYPQQNQQGQLVALRTGYENYAQFVSLNPEGEETVLYTPGFVTDEVFQLQNQLLVWTEAVPHVRWQEASRSVVFIYNQQTKKKETLRFEENILTPQLSADQKTLLAIACGSNYNRDIVVLDRKTGQEKQRIKPQAETFAYVSPIWLDEQQIAVVKLTAEGKTIVKIDWQTKAETPLTEPTFCDIRSLTYNGSELIYSAGYLNQNNIFSLNLATREITQLTTAVYGASDPSMQNGTLFYANYTPQGYQVVAHTDSQKKVFVPQQNPEEDELLKTNVLQESYLVSSNQEVRQFSSKKYSKLAHLLHFHSWAPLAIEGAGENIDIGISASSQNKLSTMFTTVGYRQRTGFEKGQAFANLRYEGFFPILSTDLTYGGRETHLVGTVGSDSQRDTALIRREYAEFSWESSISLPFNLSKGKYSTRLVPTASFDYVQFGSNQNYYEYSLTNKPLANSGDFLGKTSKQSFQFLKYRLYFSRLHKKTVRDMYSPFGQQINLHYAHSPWGDGDFGETYAASANLFFPGLFKHHGVRLYGGYQEWTHSYAPFDTFIQAPRGTLEQRGTAAYTLGIDYKFPVAYPDWSLGGLLYLKRLKAKLFLDYGAEEMGGWENNYYSYGTELTADLNFFRLDFPADIGLRIGYETERDKIFSEFLVGISF